MESDSITRQIQIDADSQRVWDALGDEPRPVALDELERDGLDVGGGQAWVDRVIAHPAMRQWEAEALAETGNHRPNRHRYAARQLAKRFPFA